MYVLSKIFVHPQLDCRKLWMLLPRKLDITGCKTFGALLRLSCLKCAIGLILTWDGYSNLYIYKQRIIWHFLDYNLSEQWEDSSPLSKTNLKLFLFLGGLARVKGLKANLLKSIFIFNICLLENFSDRKEKILILSMGNLLNKL